MADSLVEPTGSAASLSDVRPSGLHSAATALADSGFKLERKDGDNNTPATQDIKQKVERTVLNETPLEKLKPDDIKRVGVGQATDPRPEGTALEDFRKAGTKATKEKVEKVAKLKAEGKEVPLDGPKSMAQLASEQLEKEKAGEESPTLTDEKPEKKAKEAAKPAEKPAEEEKPLTVEQLDEIEKEAADPDTSPRRAKRMRELANLAKTEAAARKELEAKYKELESKGATPQTAEKLAKLEAEHAAAQKEMQQFRRRYQLEADPEIKKYDEIATRAEESIATRLKGKLSDPTLEMIKKAGGFENFSRSQEAFNIKVKNANGAEEIRTVTAQELAKSWLDALPLADSEAIRSALGEKARAGDSKKAETERLAAEASKYFEEQEQQTRAAREAQQKQLEEYKGGYKKAVDEWATKQDWMKDKEVSPTMTEEARKEAEQWNATNKQIKAALETALTLPNGLKDHVALALEAANAAHLRRELAATTKKLEAAEARANRTAAASTTVGKGGASSLLNAPKKETKQSSADVARGGALSGLEAAAARLIAGKSGAGED